MSIETYGVNKLDDMTKAAYVYQAVSMAELNLRKQTGLLWRVHTLRKLVDFKGYTVREKIRILTTGADKENKYKEYLFSYKYEILEQYYKDFIIEYDLFASSQKDKAELEQIRSLFSVLSEVLIKDYYHIRELINPKDKIIDVGANIGAYTVAVKELFPNAEILAFEPTSETYKTLVLNTKEYKGISIVNAALGKDPGTKELLVNANHLLNNISDTRDFDIKTDPLKSEKIKMETLDLYKDFKADIIKIDIEGYEEEALEGGKEFLNENKPLIICAYEHSKSQKSNLIKTMNNIAPLYKHLVLNECVMCFYVEDKHMARVKGLK